MDSEILRKYAQLIVKVGVNVQPGQEVVISSELDQPEFTELLTEECYLAGASEVRVEWTHQPLKLLHVNYQSVETLGRVKEWEKQKLLDRAENLPCMIYIESEDPNGLDGMDQEKWGKSVQMRWGIIKPIRDSMENKYQWCIAAVPGKKWAKRVFPELSTEEAVEKLWQAILYTSRADVDGIAAWREHNADLKRRCDYLNSLGLRELKYRSSNGTDFTVGLIPQAEASSTSSGEGSGSTTSKSRAPRGSSACAPNARPWFRDTGTKASGARWRTCRSETSARRRFQPWNWSR